MNNSIKIMLVYEENLYTEAHVYHSRSVMTGILENDWCSVKPWIV